MPPYKVAARVGPVADVVAALKRLLTLRRQTRPMRDLPLTSQDDQWMHQIFLAKSAQNGGVVRRKVKDVERKVGRKTFELEVRRRGFHLIEAGGQFIIICTRDPLHLIV